MGVASSIQFYFRFLNFAKPLTHIFVRHSPSNNGLEELINQIVVSLASDTLVTQTDVRLAVQQFLNNANNNNYKAGIGSNSFPYYSARPVVRKLYKSTTESTIPADTSGSIHITATNK